MDKFYVKLIIVFCLINGIGIAYSHVLERWGIENIVGLTGNILLALATFISYYYNRKAIGVKSNHVFIRMVYLSTLIKLLICLAAVVTYVYLYRGHLTKGTILLFFFLYVLYTVLETTSLIRKPGSRIDEGGGEEDAGPEE
ncbi:hypothetical protein [Compostibacter hankyongensis]|uniref:ATP synthase subunit I n=1 Tax=Compostibacter hankyongensis TaxID=1007089 RepID=A0ABP8GAX1_9BACT